MTEQTREIARVLPYCAAMWLVDASKAGSTGSKEKISAINRAIERCVKAYPGYFRGDVVRDIRAQNYWMQTLSE